MINNCLLDNMSEFKYKQYTDIVNNSREEYKKFNNLI